MSSKNLPNNPRCKLIYKWCKYLLVLKKNHINVTNVLFLKNEVLTMGSSFFIFRTCHYYKLELNYFLVMVIFKDCKLKRIIEKKA